MNSRERVLLACNHKEADRVPIDCGAMRSTGLSAITFSRLNKDLGFHDPALMYDYQQQLAFVGDHIRVVKDNLFPVPPLFKTIQEQSGTDYAEMYKVFNMGHRLEVILPAAYAEKVIAISHRFHIDAQVIGRIETAEKKELIIKSEFGEFKY